MSSNRRLIIFSLLFSGIIILLVSTTLAFFNYTRTGTENTVSVGRLNFETTSSPAINLSNAFPIDSNNVNTDTDNVGSVTINVVGDTDYDNGIEYLISAVDINNNARTGFYTRGLPISIDVTYAANGNGTSIGTSNDDYFDEGERGGNTSYYKVLAKEAILNENDPLLVGYIAPGQTGIDGNITIKAFVDRDRVAISDTYATETDLILNPNMTPELINDCVTYLTNMGFAAALFDGENLNDFCAGTGTGSGMTIVQAVNYNFPAMINNYLIEHNIIHENDIELTSDEWAGDRIIVSTSDWNDFNQDGLSFKVKVEANEGIWVDEPGKIASCPNCKFIYAKELTMYKTVNTLNKTPTVINEELTDNYLDIVNGLGKMYFLGLVLNNNNQITNAYACGMKDGTPYCVEGTPDNTKYAEKQAFLQSEELWNNTCIIRQSGSSNLTACYASNLNSVTFQLHDHGCAMASYELENHEPAACIAEENGRIRCSTGN